MIARSLFGLFSSNLAIDRTANRHVFEPHKGISVKSMNNGVIADFEAPSQMLNHFIHRAHRSAGTSADRESASPARSGRWRGGL